LRCARYAAERADAASLDAEAAWARAAEAREVRSEISTTGDPPRDRVASAPRRRLVPRPGRPASIPFERLCSQSFQI